jgi:hypothetical protein
MLSGEPIVAVVTHPAQGGYPGYNTFLLRNNTRDSDGVLRSFIKAELVAQRWGFDLQSSDGRVIATLNRQAEGFEVNEMEPSSACQNVHLTLQWNKKQTLAVLNSGAVIGKIAPFSKKWL